VVISPVMLASDPNEAPHDQGHYFLLEGKQHPWTRLIAFFTSHQSDYRATCYSTLKLRSNDRYNLVSSLAHIFDCSTIRSCRFLQKPRVDFKSDRDTPPTAKYRELKRPLCNSSASAAQRSSRFREGYHYCVRVIPLWHSRN
jgi:hypothetical protein